jgi:hypothetical protein
MFQNFISFFDKGKQNSMGFFQTMPPFFRMAVTNLIVINKEWVT